MICSCGSGFQLRQVEEWDDGQSLLRYVCPECGFEFGIEADDQEASSFFERPVWTDEALHCLERLPFYVERLVRKEVEDYAGQQHLNVISTRLMAEARNQGRVSWHPDAETRLFRVPASVRAMARVELERTALDRGMPEVTVALVKEMKARYFGMAVQSSDSAIRDPK